MPCGMFSIPACAVRAEPISFFDVYQSLGKFPGDFFCLSELRNTGVRLPWVAKAGKVVSQPVAFSLIYALTVYNHA